VERSVVGLKARKALAIDALEGGSRASYAGFKDKVWLKGEMEHGGWGQALLR